MKVLCVMAALACVLAGLTRGDTATNAFIPALPVSTLLDPDRGTIFGVSFGATEGEIVQSLGEPAGFIHLGEHRDALLYGRSQLLLMWDGKLDGIRISKYALDPFASTWLAENNHWELSNGVTSQMSRAGVLALVRAESNPGNPGRLSFHTERASVELWFTHVHGKSAPGDAGFRIDGVVVSRLINGENRWSQPFILQAVDERASSESGL
jgi:hypothetical protein